MTVNEIIKGRSLPDVLSDGKGGIIKDRDGFEKRKKVIRQLLSEKEYGVIPKKPDHMEVDVKPGDRGFCAGKAIRLFLTFSFEMDGERFSFPAEASIPKGKTNIPAFIHLSFRKDNPDIFQPTEEIIDRGFAVFTLCYTHVTSDDDNFKNGIAPYLCKSRRKKDAPGKIAIWAWAAMRLVDYVITRDEIAKDNIAVIGHSLLGKTALLTGAYDERINYIISNNSGCSGAAISRGKRGERKADICRRFPYLFCPAYLDADDDESLLPFDQHFLLALSAPRYLLVGSADEDIWQDPESEFLCLCEMERVYALYGKRGLVHGETIPQAPMLLDEGDCHYHLRRGAHYLSREDWNYYINYIEGKINAD